jgi:hypothetical protein
MAPNQQILLKRPLKIQLLPRQFSNFGETGVVEKRITVLSERPQIISQW